MQTAPKAAGDRDPLLSEGFRKVDGHSDEGQERCIRCLDFIRACRPFQDVREVGYELLDLSSPDLLIVEGGCGLGHDCLEFARRLRELGAGSGGVVGIDASERLLGEAGRRAERAGLADGGLLRFAVGDVTALPRTAGLSSGAVDRFYIERTLQHIPLEHFEQTVRGIAGLLRPGGRCVCIEPNWELFTLSGGALEVTRAFAQFWADRFNHGNVALELESALRRAGFAEIATHAAPVVFRTFEEAEVVYDMSRTIESMIDQQRLDAVAGREWLAAQRAMGDDFQCVLIMCVVSAVRG